MSRQIVVARELVRISAANTDITERLALAFQARGIAALDAET